jgi:hypothetical protein
MGKMRIVYIILVGISEGKTPLGRPRFRWEDNIRMDLREIKWKGVDWIHLDQDMDQWRALVSSNEILGSIKCGEFLDYLSDC